MGNMITLSEYCSSVRDGTHDSPKQTTEGRYLITSKHISNGRLDLSTAYKISIEDYNKINKRSKVEKWDLLMSMIGTVGRLYVVQSEPNYAIKNLALFKIGDEWKAKYLYYYLSTQPVQDYFNAVANGTSQHFVALGYLRKLKIPNWNIDTIKIIKILNNYDKLIEINNKRIKLLEQMAEELYKEWFVRFRFPGYENVKLKQINLRGWTYGATKKDFLIPLNWDYNELSKLGLFKRGKNITSTEMVGGDVQVISAGIEPSGCHNEFNVEGYNLTISASGANAGYLSYHLENIWAADCSYYNNNENIWFVYSSLKFLEPLIRNMQIGSAQPHVYAKNINRIPVIIPSDDLIIRYECIVQPLFEEIKILNNKNANLEKQRDSLLPRLMTGKLSVEGKEVI